MSTQRIYIVEHNASGGLVTVSRKSAMAAALAMFRGRMQRGRRTANRSMTNEPSE